MPSPSLSLTFFASSGFPIFPNSSISIESAVFVALFLYLFNSSLSLRYFSFFAVYSVISSFDGLRMTHPSFPSITASIPSIALSVISSTLNTPGISKALASIAECDVKPPACVMMPSTFSFTIPAVIEGVKSFATIMLPLGTSLISISLSPVRIFNRRSLISLISAALWTVSSSSVIVNISINCSHTLSTASSAHIPLFILSLISSCINGSDSIIICPSIISAFFSPAVFLICSAIFVVFSINLSTACKKRFISFSLFSGDFISYTGISFFIITIFPIP